MAAGSTPLQHPLRVLHEELAHESAAGFCAGATRHIAADTTLMQLEQSVSLSKLHLLRSLRMLMRNWRSSTSSRSALSACAAPRGGQPLPGACWLKLAH